MSGDPKPGSGAQAPPAAAGPPRAKRTAPQIVELKRRGEPIACVTAYDFPTARLADEAGVDIVLVGDSVGTVLRCACDAGRARRPHLCPPYKANQSSG